MFVYRITGHENPPPAIEVGYFCPDGDFTVVSVQETLDAARDEVHFLNGGDHPAVFGELRNLVSQVQAIASVMQRSES